jgi:diacylglycerol O-acyltransferase
VPIYIAGARQVANYPVSVITDGVGLNITVFSYQDRVDFGLVADREQMPDLRDLVDSLQQALHELATTATTPRKPATGKRRSGAQRAAGKTSERKDAGVTGAPSRS